MTQEKNGEKLKQRKENKQIAQKWTSMDVEFSNVILSFDEMLSDALCGIQKYQVGVSF